MIKKYFNIIMASLVLLIGTFLIMVLIHINSVQIATPTTPITTQEAVPSFTFQSNTSDSTSNQSVTGVLTFTGTTYLSNGALIITEATNNPNGSITITFSSSR